LAPEVDLSKKKSALVTSTRAVLRAPLAHDRDDSDTGGRHQHLVAALLLTPVTSVATFFFFRFFSQSQFE